MLGISSLLMFGYFLANINAGKCSIGFVRFMKVYDFGQNTCKKNDQAFELLNATTVSCSSICDSDVHCESFFYFPTSLKGNGCKQKYNTDRHLQNVDEQTVYYTLKVQTGYRYIGCFTPACEAGGSCIYTRSKTLTEVKLSSCVQYCDSLTNFVTTSVSLEIDHCYCNLKYKTDLSSFCDTYCRDNNEEMCGGHKLVSVYSKE